MTDTLQVALSQPFSKSSTHSAEFITFGWLNVKCMKSLIHSVFQLIQINKTGPRAMHLLDFFTPCVRGKNN